MDNNLVPLIRYPSNTALRTWNQIYTTYGLLDYLSKNKRIYMTIKEDNKDENVMAVKILSQEDPYASNEILISEKLKVFVGKTQVFVFVYGYLLSAELPPNVVPFNPAGTGYIYLFSEYIPHAFDELKDEEKINEDFYFEILIALYYARKAFHFVHYDIHEGNLMFKKVYSKEERNRSYIVENFVIQIRDSKIQPKLIDYGRSAASLEYTDKKWREPQFKKFWNKSDIYHLSLLFTHRENLSYKFRAFLEHTVLPLYKSSMYATKLERDSGANYQNIVELLKMYFQQEKEVMTQCNICNLEAIYYDVNHNVFCGKECQKQYYERRID